MFQTGVAFLAVRSWLFFFVSFPASPPPSPPPFPRFQCAVEPVWYLPEIARRFGIDEVLLRETLFKETNMMYPELVTREDLKVGW